MSAGGAILLETTGMSRAFGGLKAVDNVSFALREGIVTTLVGPNGAGKTTLFNLITGHLDPDAGDVTWLGKSIKGVPHWKIAQSGIGRTFQDLKLFDQMTVQENVLTVTERGAWLWQAGGKAGRRSAVIAPNMRWFPSGWPIAATRARSTSRMRSASSCRSRASSPRARACGCSTNRPPGWTPAPTSASSGWCATSSDVASPSASSSTTSTS